MSLWMAVFCASMTWLFSMEFYWVYWIDRGNDYPDVRLPWFVIILIIAALGFAKRGLRSLHREPLWDDPGGGPKMAAGWLLAILPTALAGRILPWPYNLGPWILAAALLITWWAARKEFSGAYLWGLAGTLIGSILTVQIPIAHYYIALEAKNHNVKYVDSAVYYILSFLGISASKGDGVVGVTMMRRLHPFSATWEKLGAVAMLYFLVGGVVLFVLFRRVRDERTTLGTLSGRVFVMFLTGAIYCVLRYAAMIMTFVYLMYFVGYSEEISRIDIFYSPLWMTLSFVPLVFVAKILFPPPEPGDSGAAPGLSPVAEKISAGLASAKMSRLEWRIVLALSAAAFLMVGYHGYHEHGSLKEGRLLFDEGHSGWEKSHRPFNKKFYGHESNYHFACLLDYLKKYYHVKSNTIREYCEPLAELERKMWGTGSITADELKAALQKVRSNQPEYYKQPAQDVLRMLEQGAVREPTRVFEELMFQMEREATPRLTRELLDDYDVLLLKNTSYAYNKQELEDIRSWVHDGGGLYVIGEHTNVFGNTTPVNELVEPFGFRFRYDCLFEVDDLIRFEHVVKAWRLLPHPVAQHLPNGEFRSAVACRA